MPVGSAIRSKFFFGQDLRGLTDKQNDVAFLIFAIEAREIGQNVVVSTLGVMLVKSLKLCKNRHPCGLVPRLGRNPRRFCQLREDGQEEKRDKAH